MSNIFAALPSPAANGSGAAVDMSAFGASKTVTVVGNGGVFEPFVTIEISNDVGASKWAPLWTFGAPGEKTFAVACRWMRATTQNYRGGGAPTVEVGGEDVGTLFASLAVPAGNGVAAATNVSTLPGFKTVVVGGQFRGNLSLEASEDGGATYSEILSFSAPGLQTASFIAAFMRVRRNGVPQTNPGTPIVNIAATIGGGSGVASIIVEEEGVPLAGAPHDTLNFVGAGVTATDAGAGVAQISVPGGITVEDEGAPIVNNPHSTMNFVGSGISVTDVAGVATVSVTGGNRQAFLYTATGAEGTSFDVPLPAARPNTNYLALVGLANQPGGLYTVEVPVSGYALNQIHVNTGVPVTAGDKFAVLVEDLT